MSTLAITAIVEAVKFIGTWILKLGYKLICKIASAVTRKLSKKSRKLARRLKRALSPKRVRRLNRRLARIQRRLVRWKSLKKWLASHKTATSRRMDDFLEGYLEGEIIPRIHPEAMAIERNAARKAT